MSNDMRLTGNEYPDEMGAYTQCDLVLRYMSDFGSITPLDAMREFGIMRLGARIYDLRKDGYPIVNETQTSRNRYGKAITYARYRMETIPFGHGEGEAHNADHN
jgi:hypothetical protein